MLFGQVSNDNVTGLFGDLFVKKIEMVTNMNLYDKVLKVGTLILFSTTEYCNNESTH